MNDLVYFAGNRVLYINPDVSDNVLGFVRCEFPNFCGGELLHSFTLFGKERHHGMSDDKLFRDARRLFGRMMQSYVHEHPAIYIIGDAIADETSEEERVLHSISYPRESMGSRSHGQLLSTPVIMSMRLV